MTQDDSIGRHCKTLRFRLSEVQELKEVLEKNHKEIVEQYKLKMTEQFNKMKSQLENARVENQALNEKIAEFEQKLCDLNQENVRAIIALCECFCKCLFIFFVAYQKESVESSGKEWDQKIESMRDEYNRLLQEKDGEIRRKNDMVQQKEIELAQKLKEINSLSQKIEKLKKSPDV